MELEVKYNPDLSNINVLEDVKSLLNQLSECYNEKIQNLENQIEGLKVERKAIRKAIKEKQYDNLNWYLGL